MKLFRPLRHRDFALLTAGQVVSMLGDGIYFVAGVWQVYELSNTPAALSLVGIAWTVPYLSLTIFGGVVTDRVDRRLVMIAGDAIRCVAMASVAALAFSGNLELWHMVVFAALYAAGDALFGPAHGAIIPELVPARSLVAANSLSHFLRPLAVALAGPALGGFIVAAWGAGVAFAIDASTFAISAVAISLIRKPPARETRDTSAFRDIVDGVRYVRQERWLLFGLLGSGATMLVMWGPLEVLLPYLIKNDLDGGPGDVGLMFTAAGLGSVLAALIMSRRELPHRDLSVMWVSSALSMAALLAYAGATAPWHVFAAACYAGVLAGIGGVIWGTLLQVRVPNELRGRVSGVSGVVSFGLLPVSYAVTGPLAEVVGTRATLFGAGLAGIAVGLLFWRLPGALAGEGQGRVLTTAQAEPEPA